MGNNILSGKVINAYLRLIKRRSIFYPTSPRVLGLDSEFLSDRRKGGFEAIRDKEIFRREEILIPVHHRTMKSNGHWSLVGVRPERKEIQATTTQDFSG